MIDTAVKQLNEKGDAECRPKGRLGNNLLANGLNFACNILIGLWFTPYLIHQLGVAAYGLIPLTMAVTSYLALFTTVLNGAVGRYLTIAIERKDSSQANSVFNTSLMGSIMIVGILSVPAVWLSFHYKWFFDVPAGYDQQFSWLFLCTMGMFFLATIGSAFSLSSYCRNRFDLSNAVSITGSIVRVSAVVVLFGVFTPRVWHVGVGLMLAGVVSMVGGIIVWRHLTPMLRIQPRMFRLATLRLLTATGGWMVVNQVGSLLYLSIDLIVVNRVLGADATGRYGALMQWSSMLRGIAGVVAVGFGPTILALYAHNDTSGMIAYSQRAVKFLGLVIALPIGLICGLSRPLLHVWLGPGFVTFAPLMFLMTFHLCINLGVLPLFNLQLATGNVRLPGIVTCVLGAMNLGLAVILAGPVGWGMYGVAAAGAIMLTAKNLIFTPLYGAHILREPWWIFYRETRQVWITTIAIAVVGWFASGYWDMTMWLRLAGFSFLMSLCYVWCVYQYVLSRTDRLMFSKFIVRA